MVNHTQEFLEKHARLLKRREKERQEKLLKKEKKIKQTYHNKLSRQRKKYEELKKDKEAYEKYLATQKIYREKYKKDKTKYKNEKEKSNNEYFVGYKKIKLKGRKGVYYINKDGEIYNSNRVKLNCRKLSSGYVEVTNHETLHRILWRVFNGEIPEGMEIDHINTIRDDNRLENLRLVTHKENCNNPTSIENYSNHNKSVDRSYLKKKTYQYTLDGELVKVWESAAECGKNGYGQSSVCKCCNDNSKTYKGFKWTHEPIN